MGGGSDEGGKVGGGEGSEVGGSSGGGGKVGGDGGEVGSCDGNRW